jgi:putative membrane protein
MATIILPTISTSFIALSAIFVAAGWVSIRKGNREAHQKRMTVGAVLATLFFITYVSRTALLGNTMFGGPQHVKVYYQTFLFFHIVLATVAAVMGLITLYRAYKKQFVQHKRIGPWTAIIWFATAVTGVTVYTLLYILYPGGTRESVLKVIFGW